MKSIVIIKDVIDYAPSGIGIVLSYEIYEEHIYYTILLDKTMWTLSKEASHTLGRYILKSPHISGNFYLFDEEVEFI